VPLNDVAYIFCTHSHLDHTGAAAILKKTTGASVFAFKGTQDKKLTINHDSTITSTDTFVPDVFLSDNQLINCDDEIVEVIKTPGHTDDHICLFFHKRNILFTGDLMIHDDIGLLNLNKHYSESLNEFSKSIEKCSQIHPSAIFPGHGNPVFNSEKILNNAERKLLLFRKNPLLLIPHTLISPLLFFIGTRESVTIDLCEKYVLEHSYLFEGFIDITQKILKKELLKVIMLLKFRNILSQNGNTLKMNISFNKIETDWINTKNLQAC
jgi:glyoxylase-like metal-dependent hydrolase (beta-lactamase superfamily II)